VNLQDIKPSARIKGILPNETVQIVSAQPRGETAVEPVNRNNDGTPGQQLPCADTFELELRQKKRLEELAPERKITVMPSVVLGGAWIIPRSMLLGLSPDQINQENLSANRDEIERIAREIIL